MSANAKSTPSVPGPMLRIEYYRSAIACSWRQKAIVRGLGFTKLRQVVVRPDHPAIHGMVEKIPHLVRILEAQTAGPKP